MTPLNEVHTRIDASRSLHTDIIRQRLVKLMCRGLYPVLMARDVVLTKIHISWARTTEIVDQ